MNVARKHHFVPRGYLAGFTDDGTRNGQLTVFDLELQKTFPATPRKVAAKRDFNRIDVEGLPPDAVEQALGKFEGKAIATIRRLQEHGGSMTNDELSDIVTLMTLLVARNPRRRRRMNAARRHGVRVIADMLTSNRLIYESHLARAKRDGFVSKDAHVPFEKLANFVREDRYTVEISTTENLRQEVGVSFNDIFDTLASRSWSLVMADTDAPEFVTCDHPVAVVFKDNGRRGPIGYALPGTEVSFPLGPRHAVIGVLENPLRPQFTAGAKGVAALNSRTLYHADRQVYATSRRILILQSGGIAEFDVLRDRQDQ